MKIKEFYQWYSPGFWTQAGMSSACMVCFTLYGIEQGILANLQTQENFLQLFGNPGSTLLGLIVSIYTLGSFIGCLVNLFFVGESLGRKRTIWLGLALIKLGVILQVTAFTRPHLMVGRFITGLGTGIETSTTPMYQAEVCDARYRGRLVSAEPLFVAVGVVISYWIGYGFSFIHDSSVSWRFPIAFQLVLTTLSMVMFLGCPESPRWLVNRRRADEALQVLALTQGKSEDDPDVVKVLNDIVEIRDLEEEGVGITWSMIFRGKDNVRAGYRILLAWGAQCINQLGGVNLVVYYMPFVLEQNVGLDVDLSRLIGGCINFMFFVGSLYPTFYLDKHGRRPVMIWGSVAMGVCMLMITILLRIDTHATSLSATAFFFLFIAAFGASMNCCGWVYVPEILPLQIRARGMAIGVSSNWMWNFVIAMITPVMTTNIGWRTYIVFTVTNFTAAIVLYFFYPETNQKSLEEIDLLFAPKEEIMEKQLDQRIEVTAV